MDESLFRMEVLEARQATWLGGIRLQAPRIGWIFLALSLLAVAAVLALLIFGHYTRHEQIAGALVPSRGLLTLTPTTSGVVARVLVVDGQAVRAGQPLLEISSEQDSVVLGNTHEAIATQLDIKRSNLEIDLKQQQQLVVMQQQDLQSRIILLRQQIESIDQQTVLQQQRADSAWALYEQWAALGGSGVVSKLQLLQQRDTSLQNRTQLKELQRQGMALRQQTRQLQDELNQLPFHAASKHRETERQLTDVAQSLSQNEAQRAVLLRASSDGTVVNVLVHPGQSIVAQQPLLMVLPANSELLAELWVPSKAVGFINQGDLVTLRYPAYPYQKFGQHVGSVRDISRSAMQANELKKLLGQEVKEARYRVLVTLEHQNILAYGRLEWLKPGLAVDADVLLDRRRLIEWVAEPLYGLAQSMSEPRSEKERSPDVRQQR
jgi:membrane fusion protein